MFLITFVLVAVNFFQFIVRCGTETKQNRKKRFCHAKKPLLAFYLLTAILLTTDMLFCILIVKMEVNYAPFLRYLPETWKVLLGIDQLWLLVEFIYHLHKSIIRLGVIRRDS